MRVYEPGCHDSRVTAPDGEGQDAGVVVVIRVERPDGAVARALLARYYAELAERFPDGFDVEQTVAAPAVELVAPHGAFLVVRIDGSPGGCGAVRRLDENVAEIKRMWVDPGYRGRGIARRLLMELEASARELGCDVVRLDTSAHLTEALALYRRSGYADIPPYNANPYAAYWLEKQLR